MTATYEAMIEQPAVPARVVNWRQVGTFIGLTFGLTWLLDLILYLSGGLKNPAVSVALPLQMLLPAFCALVLGMFFFKDSPIYRKNNKTLSRWFIYFYYLMVFMYIVGAVLVFSQPEMVQTVSGILLIPGVLGLILLVVLRLAGGKDTFSSVGMGGGKPIYWLVLGLGLIGFYALSTLLNYVFKLGSPADLSALLPAGSPIAGPAMLGALALNIVIIGPFLGLIVTFGEEYGWRGFLQSQMNGMGRIKGTLLIGVIWGVWHWPLIWMGYNFPGQPVIGSLLMTGMCINLAFFLAYAVFKSGGVWTAAYLHALNNQAASFFMGVIYTPTNMHVAFGIGLLGFLLGGLVVLFLLRDPVWKE